MKNSKAKGSRNEHKSKRMLEAQGYRCTKSGGSLGEWDLICVSDHDTVMVQVKSNRMPPKDEMRRMLEFPVGPAQRKELHVWKDYKKVPVIIQIGTTTNG